MTSSGEAEIHVVPYDASWPKRFQEERVLLASAIGPYVTGTIEHVGSTAVPGLSAKPIIDIMAGVDSLETARPAIAILKNLDYCHFPYRDGVMHWFCKPTPLVRTHHLHLVPFESPLWMDRLAFRDYLREHPKAATEYQNLKRELARRYRLDRQAYTEAKAPFIRAILARVEE